MYNTRVCRLGTSSLEILTSTTPAHRQTRHTPQHCRFVDAANIVVFMLITDYEDTGIARDLRCDSSLPP